MSQQKSRFLHIEDPFLLWDCVLHPFGTHKGYEFLEFYPAIQVMENTSYLIKKPQKSMCSFRDFESTI